MIDSMVFQQCNGLFSYSEILLHHSYDIADRKFYKSKVYMYILCGKFPAQIYAVICSKIISESCKTVMNLQLSFAFQTRAACEVRGALHLSDLTVHFRKSFEGHCEIL